MAQPELQSFIKRGLAVGPAGTPLTSSANAIQILDGTSTTSSTKTTRNTDRAVFGGKAFNLSDFLASIKGKIELTPPSVPGDAVNGIASAEPVLLPCAIARTLAAGITRYNPISENIPACDMNWWHSATFLEVSAARGDISELRMEIGQPFTAQVDLQGPYDEVTSSPLPTDFDYSGFPSPTVAEPENTTLILNSLGTTGITNLHLRAKSLVVNKANQRASKRYTEHREMGITGSSPTFDMLIALPDLGEFNPDTIMRLHEHITVAFRLYEPDGRWSELGVRGQIETVVPTDTEGDFNYRITGECIPSDAGSDEWYAAFGNGTFRMTGIAPAAEEGEAYTFAPTTLGDFTAPVAYTISAGALPDGLTINAATGAITGSPSNGEAADSPFAVTITATDSTPTTPKVATLALSIIVTA